MGEEKEMTFLAITWPGLVPRYWYLHHNFVSLRLFCLPWMLRNIAFLGMEGLDMYSNFWGKFGDTFLSTILLSLFAKNKQMTHHMKSWVLTFSIKLISKKNMQSFMIQQLYRCFTVCVPGTSRFTLETGCIWFWCCTALDVMSAHLARYQSIGVLFLIEFC